ncbi:flavoprotein [Clostridium aceticum]|uniref:Flavoprotein n=1 Tax=Clostridium aceticum TaxID=84022 RepID=A0A0D8IBA4_9CLOT|nr:NAD(P)/FAD-dependent oxidoreductase [Clostridium aceticum]AKL96803.1 flavoprotein [Clostridium aceticum]KJF27558.1 flavoprotein [Clostridium aceticum]
MTKQLHVLVIGGGAAGLTAAIAAARNGASVTILEKMDRVGKKILATGNGRCNLTNMNMDLKFFHGKNVRFAQGILNSFDVEQTLNFFEYLGIASKVEEGGKVYPMSDQASSILDVLRYELQQLGVKEYCNAEVIKIQKNHKGFTVVLKDKSTVEGDKVILATGGKASPQLGSDGEGYILAKELGHRLIDVFPALVQVKLKAPFLKALKGVKFIGEASLVVGEKKLRKEAGEILFTDYGISGPPILQLSRIGAEALNNKEKVYITLDMFPHLQQEEVMELLQMRLAYQSEKSLDFSFIGLLNKRLIPVVLREVGMKDLQKKCGQVSQGEMKNMVKIFKEWKIEVTDTQSWRNAQTTAGGIDVSEIDGKTMQSKLVPGIYFAGELVDIDGDCGGFNLQWAWSSGYIAGEYAALDTVE